MKPLTQTAIVPFIQRFDSFRDAELRQVEVIDPFEIQVVIAAQDKAREYDWITVTLQFTGVMAANLVEENQLQYIDMQDGLSLLYEDSKFAFGIGACYNISSIETSSLYILSQSVKFEEGQF